MLRKIRVWEVLGLVLLGLVVGMATALLGVELLWAYVVVGVVVVIVVPVVLRRLERR
ncbi:hypothetical protein [Lentzea jiangxiensis]|uniref:Uncharacterized protein n=1 Tax=Lentzea jiangxiensis TaxID=641025 RepID=A0A1H0JCH1_9PSEU|nr:hypothetical protein [Lentzea jiangxiensis]SDO41312.1 hypothetical protein SAMN05421507_102451 [Lentzea jiangxiensis]